MEMESKINDQYVKAIKKRFPMISLEVEKYIPEYKKNFDRSLEVMLHSLPYSHNNSCKPLSLPSKIPFMKGYIHVEKERIIGRAMLEDGEITYIDGGMPLLLGGKPFPFDKRKIIKVIPSPEMYYPWLWYEEYEDDYKFFQLNSIGNNRPICMMVDGKWQFFYRTRSKNKFPTMELTRFLRSMLEYNFILFIYYHYLDTKSFDTKSFDIKLMIKKLKGE